MNNSKNAAIFAETPFQLVLGLNIAFNHLNCEKATLFLTREMYNSDRVFTVNDSPGFIENVYYIKRNVYPKSVIKRIIRKIKIMFSSEFDSFCESKPPKKIEVDCVLGMKFSTPIIPFLKKYNLFVPAFFFEEGFSDYTLDELNVEYNELAEFKASKNITQIIRYAMFPELFFKVNQKKTLPAYTAQTKDFVLILDQIFEKNNQKLDDIDMIYFDRPVVNYSDDIITSYHQKEKIIIDLLKTITCNKAYKVHPRSNKELNGFLTVTAPWEILLTDAGNFQDTTLVMIPSTILLTGKFLFGREFKMILMTKIFEDELVKMYGQVGIDDMILIEQSLIDAYSDKSKIIIPETIEEFEGLINSF